MLAIAFVTYATKTLPYEPFLIAFFVGQFALAAIIGGLVGRTWIAGWLFSVALATIGTLIFWIVAMSITGRIDAVDRLGICCLWPLLMLGACAPLVVMRALRGWTFTQDENIVIPKQASSVEDLLLLTVIVASCIAIAKLLEEFDRSFQIGVAFFFIGFVSGYSVFFILPAIAITFRAHNWLQRCIGWLAVTMAVFLCSLAINWVLDGSNFWRSLQEVAIGVSTAAVTIMIGGWALLASGVKLTHFAKTGTLDSTKIDSVESAENASKKAQRQARLLTGLVAFGAVMSAVVVSFSDYRELNFLKSIQRQNKIFPNEFSELTIRGEKVVGITLATMDPERVFDRYQGVGNHIEQLSLSGTQITDAGLKRLAYFPNLQHLDLSNTAITNDGLPHLSVLKQLTTLSVANTKVDYDRALGIGQALNVKELDVSGLGVTDEHIHNCLAIGAIQSLKLSHNPITDVGVAELLKNSRRLWKLDVSDTAIDGSGILPPNRSFKVNLDGTNITDANLIALLKLGGCTDISIRRTGITAAVLPTLSSLGISLALGEGPITEADLENLSSAAFSHLSLNDKNFTGACLASGKVTVKSLDLSNSGVTDKTLIALASLRSFNHLDLSNTEISDAALPSINSYEVDLRHTRVSAAGLLKAPRTIMRILIDHNQFTTEELVSLRNRNTRVVVDEKSQFRR